MVKFTATISDPVMRLTMCLLHSVTNGHILHLSTNSYSKHKALETFYTEIGDHADDFIEAFQGKYGLLTKYTDNFELATDPIEYITYVADEIETLRKAQGFPQDTYLQNILDEMLKLVYSTLYKLKFLN
jgi:hypothetical protein